MSKDKIVYTTLKGSKYHFNSSCVYLKGKITNKISLQKAKQKLEGPCSGCLRLMGKKEEDKKSFEDEDQKENNHNIIRPKTKKSFPKKNKKENKDKIIIGNNINNKNYLYDNKIKFSNRDESGGNQNNNKEKKLRYYSPNNTKSNKKEDILNNKNNNSPLINGNISNILSNDNYSLFPEAMNKNEKSKYNKKTINNNKYINKKEIKKENKNNNEKLNEKIRNNSNEVNNNNNIIKNNNIINNNNIYNYLNDKDEKKKIINEESDNLIDSFEIQNEPLNNINNISNINEFEEYLIQKYRNNKELNWLGSDFKLLDETNQSAKLVYLKNLFEINDNMDENIFILSEKKNDKNNNISNLKPNDLYKGNFKFKFEISPFKEIVEPIKITVGFEIDYIDKTDINVINDGYNMLNDEKEIKIGALYETLVVLRHFYIYRKTNTVHVLINICSGKFFVVGESELEKRNNREYLKLSNSEILYLRTFKKISLNQIKKVRPIFKYNKNDLKIVNININGNNLDKKVIKNN